MGALGIFARRLLLGGKGLATSESTAPLTTGRGWRSYKWFACLFRSHLNILKSGLLQRGGTPMSTPSHPVLGDLQPVPASPRCCRDTESHRITAWWGWKGPLWVTQPKPLPKQGHPQQAAQHRVQAGLEYLQRRRLHSLPRHPQALIPVGALRAATRKAGFAALLALFRVDFQAVPCPGAVLPPQRSCFGLAGACRAPSSPGATGAGLGKKACRGRGQATSLLLITASFILSLNSG